MDLRTPFARFREPAFTLLRIASGLMFSFHGMQKLFGVLSDFQPPAGSQLWIGGVIELACGLLIAIGLFTTWAALLASGEMAVAYTQFHWKLHAGAQLFPAINKGELALVYAFVFLFVCCHGAGRFSVDGYVASHARGAGGPMAGPSGQRARDNVPGAAGI
jgi:putative oxidoreductase